MSEQLIEQPVIEAPITEADLEPDAPASILEHARTFGPQAEKVEPEPDPLKPIRPVDQQKRQNGQFAEGRKPMKAAETVKRINELTFRAKSAEERHTAAEARAANAERELAQLRQSGGTRQEVAQAERKVEQAQATVERQQPHPSGFAEPEPQEDDPKFGGDYTKYVRALGGWEGRKGAWEFRQQEQHQASQAKLHQTWDTRIAAAVAKYPDYMDTARATLQRVPQNSVIHVFVEDDPSGEDVLYYLGKNPQELDAILRMPTALAQVKAVSLLSQRFASPPSNQAGSTTSAGGRSTHVVLPRPPNVVRTEAQRASDSPPTGEPSSIAEHRKRFAPSR